MRLVVESLADWLVLASLVAELVEASLAVWCLLVLVFLVIPMPNCVDYPRVPPSLLLAVALPKSSSHQNNQNHSHSHNSRHPRMVSICTCIRPSSCPYIRHSDTCPHVAIYHNDTSHPRMQCMHCRMLVPQCNNNLPMVSHIHSLICRIMRQSMSFSTCCE